MSKLPICVGLLSTYAQAASSTSWSSMQQHIQDQPRRSSEQADMDTKLPKGMTAPKKASFSCLPAELKLCILEAVYETGTSQDYLNALRIDHHTNAVGSSLVWSNIAITNDNFFLFVRSLVEARSTTCARIRNLSILLNPVSREFANPFYLSLTELGFPKDRWSYVKDSRGLVSKNLELKLPDYLTPLAIPTLPFDLRRRSPGNVCLASATQRLGSMIKEKMSSLVTFSYRVTPVCEDPYMRDFNEYYADQETNNGFLPVKVLASLIEALPSTCTQVELVTSHHDAMYPGNHEALPETDSNVYCEALDNLLPRLTHLHLGGDNISPFVFGSLMTGPALPNLRELSLDISSMTTSDQRYTGYTSLSEALTPSADPTVPLDLGSPVNLLKLQNLVAHQLRVSVTASRFPAIQLLYLIARQSHGSIGLFTETRHNTLDILNCSIDVIPFAMIDARFHLDPYLHNHDTTWGTESWMYKPGNHVPSRFIDENEVGELATRTWVSSWTGIRVPVSECTTRRVRVQGFEWKDDERKGMKLKQLVRAIKRHPNHQGLADLVMDVNEVCLYLGTAHEIAGLVEWYGNV